CQLVQLLPRFQYDPDRGRFRNWLRKLVENQAIDHWRRHHPGLRQLDDPDRVLLAWPDAASLDDLADDLHNRLLRDLQAAEPVTARVARRVAERSWEAYWQFSILGQPAREVGARLGLSARAVSQAAYRVAEMLRQEWSSGPRAD